MMQRLQTGRHNATSSILSGGTRLTMVTRLVASAMGECLTFILVMHLFSTSLGARAHNLPSRASDYGTRSPVASTHSRRHGSKFTTGWVPSNAPQSFSKCGRHVRLLHPRWPPDIVGVITNNSFALSIFDDFAIRANGATATYKTGSMMFGPSSEDWMSDVLKDVPIFGISDKRVLKRTDLD